jgi:hypothetical protein
VLFLVAVIALGQCTKDTDCKGDRICSNGECVAPAPGLSLSDLTRDRTAEVARLRDEIAGAESDLEGADLRAPTWKFCVAGALFILGGALFGIGFTQRNQDVQLSLLVPGIVLAAVGAVFGVIATVQFRRQRTTQKTAPLVIRRDERRLRELGAEP